MHGPAAAALAPFLAFISPPPFLSVAVIGAIAVVVYEMRRLVRALSSTSVLPAPRRVAARALNLAAAVPDRDRSAVGGPAPAIVLRAHAPLPERGPAVTLELSDLRDVTAQPVERAAASDPLAELMGDGSPAPMEPAPADEDVTTAVSVTNRPPGDDARHVRLVGGRSLELRRISTRLHGRLITFMQRLPLRSRIALAVDLASGAMIQTRLGSAGVADTHTIVAYEDGRLVGYASLRRAGATWTRHVGEICIVAGGTRHDAEVGACLGHEIVAAALDLGLGKVSARIIWDDAPTRAIFESLGFSAEAILADHWIDEEQRTHDVLILSAARGQLIDVVPRELRALASVSSETGAHDSSDATPGEPPPVALPADVALAPTVAIEDPEVAIIHSHTETSSPPADAPLAERSPVAAAARDTGDAASIPHAEESAASLVHAATTRGRAGRLPMRRVYPIAAMAATIVALAFVSFYATVRQAGPRQLDVLGASARPTPGATAATAPAFETTQAGSGGVFIPVSGPATVVRVTMGAGVTGAWFWCFESSFGLPLADHYCAGDDADGGSGASVTHGVIHVDPAWPADAAYFVQMYCEGPCVWHIAVLQVAPR